MKALISGFEPFGTLAVNASWEAARLVSDDIGGDLTVKKLCLPVEYDRCWQLLADEIARLTPDIVLCLGVAASRRVITPEYVAVNVKNSAQPDNAGRIFSYEPIVEEGESALYTGLPLPQVLSAIHAVGLPAAPSFDAGAYVCNNLFYHLMYHIKYSERPFCGGFIHLPPESEIPPQEAAKALESVLVMLAEPPHTA